MATPLYERVGGRDRLVAATTQALEDACPGSEVTLRGSLAKGTADAYSDIDLAWVVPDDQVAYCVEALHEVLPRVGEVASIRSDPDFQRSRCRRLMFVRFANVPLFWRLDLEVWAASNAFDETCDVHNPDARGDAWSLPESASMNAVGAVKMLLRGRPEAADGLLTRGYARIGAPDPGGSWAGRIATLATETARQETSLEPLATAIRAHVRELL